MDNVTIGLFGILGIMIYSYKLSEYFINVLEQNYVGYFQLHGKFLLQLIIFLGIVFGITSTVIGYLINIL